MKQNVLQNVIGFVLKYIWIFCALLVLLEVISVTYTANILMKQSTLGVMQSVSGEISGRVDGVLRLLTGLSNDERFSDDSVPMFDRVIQTMPYKSSYNLFMIALTNEDVDVISTSSTEPPEKMKNLGARDYMKRLYATGEFQITDAFPAGLDNTTMNYTIAVPIFNGDVVKGTVFGAIYFEDIENILERSGQADGNSFFLLGENNTIMAGGSQELYGKSFLEMSKNSRFFGDSAKEMDVSMREGESGNTWELGSKGLTYMTYQKVEPTDWTLVYRVQFSSVIIKLLPTMGVKICFYIMMCGAVHLLGRRYLTRHLAEVNHLLNRMATMQRELFQSEQPDYDNLLELTQQGLTDQLTGLSTRAILFKKMTQITSAKDRRGAVVFIDLDDLKRINDNFGHEGGDCALLHFAQILKEYEQKYNGVAARYGGDEFILIFSAIGRKEASEIAESLCKDLNTSISIREHSFSIHGSLGISFYPDHGTNPEELICRADLALYAAKQEGKNQCAFYTDNGNII